MINFLKKKNLIAFLAFIFILPLFISAPICANAEDINVSKESEESGDGDKVDILFTHDLHSYLASYNDLYKGEIVNLGGFARLSTLIKAVKEDNPETLLIDGGDLTIGTLYQTLLADEALELRLLGELDFDATTFGNHDFDYNSTMLASMFNRASEECDTLPALVICNFDWKADNKETKEIYDAALKCNLCDYTIVNKNGVNIAILGVFGKVATSDSPTLKIPVLDQIESVKKTVDYIKANENADMIVCISHSGIDSDIKKSEDEQLALAVPGIDVILSAHTHTYLEEPIVHGDTYIMSCGCYGMYTGHASFEKKDNGRWNLIKYNNILMDSSIEEDTSIVNRIKEYDKLIDTEYLKNFNLTTEEVLAYNPYNFEAINDMYYVRGEHALGNFLSDSYRYAVNQNEPDSNAKVISVVPAGTVRGTFLTGDVTTKDAFQAYSLGLGYDNKVGYPLLKFYVKGEDLILIPEIDASLSVLMPTANLYCSGLNYKIGLNRVFLNKAYDIKYTDFLDDDNTQEINKDELYVVVTDLYTAKMIGSVSSLSKGLIKITPLLEDGSPLPFNGDEYDWEKVVLRDNNGNEVKTWFAIASYLKSFNNSNNGVISDYYSQLHNRKMIIDKANVISQTNKYFWIITGSIGLSVVILISIILGVIKLIKKIASKKHV